MPRPLSARIARAREHDGSIGLDLAKGAVAGVVATFVLDRVDWFLYGLESDEVYDRTWAARPERKDPAHVLASRASVALGGDPIPQDHIAGHLVHYAIGITPVIAYAALRERNPAITAGGGLGFGLAMGIVEDHIMNPLLGLAAPPQDYPWQPHARGLISHLVYGLVAEGVLRALSSVGERRVRHDPA